VRIGEVKLPLLILQPENDGRVARYHAERLSEAAGVPYHLVPDREHTDVLAAPVTVRLVEEFLSRLG
jgi:dipeptidyl aminopeptidase/acylaminoacyl peptidase